MPRDVLRRALWHIRRTVGSAAATGTPTTDASPVRAHDVQLAPRPVLGYVVAGGGGAHPASAHVRVVRRVEHLVASGRADARQVDPEAFVAGTDDTPYASLLVQRDVLPLALVADLLAAAAARGIPVVAEVDDDFFTDSGRARLARAEYDPGRLASIDAVVRGADRVVVSTEELADVVRPVARRVVVVRNALDPAIWAADVPRVDDDLPVDEHRVLYMGTLTHAADLALLRDAFTGLVADDGLPIRLEVIGVTDASDGDDWYRRVEVPDGHYPAFARWLVEHRGRWSAGVAPLQDEAFNEAKSDLKALEYVALDLPAVVSDRPSYAAAAAHGVTAVPDDPDAWRAALRAAVARDGAEPDAVTWVRSERMIGGPQDSWPDAVLG